MKGIEKITPEIPKPPHVNILEGSKNIRERSFETISDIKIHGPEDVPRMEHNTDFERACRMVIGNEELEMLAIKGLSSPENVLPYATLTNKITEACLALSDNEIENIIRKFEESLRSHATRYASELTGKQLENLQTGKWGSRYSKNALDPNGIKAVAHFVRARKMLHAASPQTFPAFYFENYLDAHHKIDLVEVLEGAEGVTINLIQIKSHEYNPDDIKNITQSHGDWVNEFTTDLSTYEKNFSIEPENSQAFREFFEKADNIGLVLIEVLTDDESPDKNLLYEKLGIGKLPKVEQVWILEQYLPVIEEELEKMVSSGWFTGEYSQKISNIINDLKTQLEKAHKHKKDLAGVSEIHSLCAVGEKVVSDTVIFKAGGNDRKAIRISDK